MHFLISGIPASGKSTFCRWLEEKKSFLHLDVEKSGVLDRYGLATAWATFLDEAYEQANRLLNVQRDPATGIEQDERATELAGIETDITQYLNETFPRASVRLKVRLPSVKSILGQIDVVVREGAHEDPYYRRGHGLQRTLYLSLLRALAARIRRQTEQRVVRPFVLLFEEPEAFLHPEGQIKMRNALQAIATRAQVAMATHSPIMVTPEFVPHTVRVEKRRQDGLPKAITKRFGPIGPTTLTEHQRQLLPLFAIQRSARFLFPRCPACRGNRR